MKAIATLVVAGTLVGPVLAQAVKTKPVEAGAQRQEEPKEFKRLELGKKAPHALSLRDIDGDVHDLSAEDGKITVVNFWSLRCPVQKAWDPALCSIIEEFEKQDVRFLMVDSNGRNEVSEEQEQAADGAESYPQIRAVLAERKLPYTVLVDRDNLVADVLGAQTTPHVFVFDQKGRLVYHGLVDDDQRGKPEKKYLRDTLTALVAGKSVKPTSTRPKGCSIKRVVTDRPFEDAADAKTTRVKRLRRGGK